MLEPKLRSGAPSTSGRARELLRQPRSLLAGVAAVAVAAGLGACGGHSSPSSKSTARSIAPVGLSAKGLRTLAAVVGPPIYWAGPKPGYLYELTRTETGNVVIRYLPPGAKVGARTPYMTIATYHYRNALQALKNVAHGRQRSLPGGGIAVVDEKSPTSVHLAYPGVNYQVEVYDPSPGRSLQVALTGDVRPVS